MADQSLMFTEELWAGEGMGESAASQQKACKLIEPPVKPPPQGSRREVE